MSARRKRMPRWNADGLRWCPDCQAYISPELFNRTNARSRPDGYRQYCRVHQHAREAVYQARRMGAPASRSSQRAYRTTTYIAHGRVPEEDRRTAEALHLLGREAIHTGSLTRPHVGTVVGLQINTRYGLLVWMDFSRDPLALDTATRETLALIKAGYIELSGADQKQERCLCTSTP